MQEQKPLNEPVEKPFYKQIKKVLFAMSLGVTTTAFTSLLNYIDVGDFSGHGFPFRFIGYVYTGIISDSGYQFGYIVFLIDALILTILWLIIIFILRKLIKKEIKKTSFDYTMHSFIALILCLPGIKYSFSEAWSAIPLPIAHIIRGELVIGWFEFFINLFSWYILSYLIVHIVFYLKRLTFNRNIAPPNSA